MIGSLALGRLQGDLGLEGRRVVASWSSWHGLSSSSVGCRGAVSPIGPSDFARPLLLRVVDRAGATLWEVGFAKRLVTVDVVGDELVCAAGVVMVFSGQGGT